MMRVVILLACAVAVWRVRRSCRRSSNVIRQLWGGEGRKNCHPTTFTPRSGMCKDIDTFSKSCWSSVDKTKTFKFSTKIHKDAEAAIQSEVLQSESVAFGTSPSKILVATMCFGFGATAKAAGTYGGGYMQPPRPMHATAKSDNQGGSFAPS